MDANSLGNSGIEGEASNRVETGEMFFNTVVYLLLTITDWALTKIGLAAGVIERNPIVDFVGGIDSSLVLKLACWLVAIKLSFKLNEYGRGWAFGG